MIGKIIGAMLIILCCGGLGWSISAESRREEETLRQLISALDYMQCELQYRMTPLPDLCLHAGREQNGIIGNFFSLLARELEDQVSPEVSSCVRAAMSRLEWIPKRLDKALRLLGMTLGRFDVTGQLAGLEQVRQYCRDEVSKMADNRDTRLRSYQTLGLCAGAALAILFV